MTAHGEELHYSSLKDQLALSDARKTRYCHYNKCYKLTEYSGGQEQHNNAGEPEDWRGTGLKLVKCDSSKSNRRSARSSITSRPGTRSAYTYEQLAWLLRSARGGRPGSFTAPPHHPRSAAPDGYLWLSGYAESSNRAVGVRTCDQEVARSIPSCVRPLSAGCSHLA